MLSEHNKVNSDNTATIQVTQNIYGADKGSLADKASFVWGMTPMGQAQKLANRAKDFIGSNVKSVLFDNGNSDQNGY